MILFATKLRPWSGLLGLALSIAAPAGSGHASPTPAGQTATSSIAKTVGTVKAISGNMVTVTTDAASTESIEIQDSTRMIRTAPGQKDLKEATPIGVQDLQIGDRLLVRGKASDDGKSILAASVIVIKGTDIAARQEREREDWQKRGTGGLVTAVDANAGTITVSTSGMGANQAMAVHISKDTIIRRYSPNSVKFDDAKPGTLSEIKVGDQLRARGTRSAEGSELVADEIVSGTFRNIAGTVISANAANNSVSVLDLLTKQPVDLTITADSQLRSLPPMVAQRIAMRLKGGPPQAGQNGNGPAPLPAGQTAEPRPSGFAGGRPGGTADFQQMLSRMPAVTLADLPKGTAVMIVATEGTANNQSTAVTLLTGVEPILAASPDGSRAAMLLSPWNLGGAGAEAGTNP